MEFKQLFEMQAELDRFIETTKNVERDVFKEKSLALIVELAELANETRCFKYWSSKAASERLVLLEEFVDSIHFMLSLGNMRGFSLTTWPEVEQTMDLTQAFLMTTATVMRFTQQPTKEHYDAMWHDYALLAYNLSFSVKDILQAYVEKNEKNYERQRSGY